MFFSHFIRDFYNFVEIIFCGCVPDGVGKIVNFFDNGG